MRTVTFALSRDNATLVLSRIAEGENMICQHCGSGFGPVRRDAKYCSARCRQAARRRRLREEAEARRRCAATARWAMLDKLAAVLPATAAKVEKFVQDNGADCAEAAVKLVLTAYAEAVAERV